MSSLYDFGHVPKSPNKVGLKMVLPRLVGGLSEMGAMNVLCKLEGIIHKGEIDAAGSSPQSRKSYHLTCTGSPFLMKELLNPYFLSLASISILVRLSQPMLQ